MHTPTADDYQWAQDLAKRCVPPRERDDASQEACVAILEVSRVFHGPPDAFRTFAWARVRGAALDHMRFRLGRVHQVHFMDVEPQCTDSHLQIEVRDAVDVASRRFLNGAQEVFLSFCAGMGVCEQMSHFGITHMMACRRREEAKVALKEVMA